MNIFIPEQFSNPEVYFWRERVFDQAGGTVNRARAQAHDAFVSTCKRTSGLWDAILPGRMNTFGADNFAGIFAPLVNTVGNATDTNFNFASSDFSPTASLTGDGATKYLDTGGAAPLSSGHLCAVVVAASAGAFPNAMGQWDGGSNISAIGMTGSGAGSSHCFYGNISDFVDFTSTTGCFQVVLSDGALTGYRNGASIQSVSTAAMTSSESIYIYNRNYSGSPDSSFFSGAVGAYSFGEAMTSTQAAAYERVRHRMEMLLQPLDTKTWVSKRRAA